ncbi:hypothetical protein EG850_04775 [Gulosibacter macacae]|uniref:Cache domain-containing protein n=1 Tax=Gulosibacter macacae TaxID=2488791 RepID=A0A3P3VZV9_9MICO|nr:cache domain-containing protein [Gulosibacter macacae]RRJ87618.1 hypothetical protein EG850_04775 [Gulosibacter macacae]
MTNTPETLAAEFTARFDELIASLRVIGVNYVALLEPRFGRHEIGPFDHGDLTRMRDLSYMVLDSHEIANGAGVIFTPERIAVKEECIQWHVRGANGYEPYGFVFNENSPEYYDFLQLPWFSVPRDEGLPHLHGPYVDFLGVDEYTLTCSIPIEIGGRFAGVAASDLNFAKFEQVFLELARGIDEHVALVNLDGRIVCTTSSRFLPGEKVDKSIEHRVIDLEASFPTLRVVASPK